MGKPTVRSDDQGLFLRSCDNSYRPGSVRGLRQRRRMDDGGLVVGDVVRAEPVAGTDLVRVTLPDGTATFWHADGAERMRGLVPPPEGARWKPDGMRDFRGTIIG